MKVLVVTGRLAEDQVRVSARGADVMVMDVDVAAFITPRMLIEAAPSGYDLILIPGAITADFGEAERILGSKIRLGPKHAADLEFVLGQIDRVELSDRVPACELLGEMMRRDALARLVQLESDALPSLRIRGVGIGGSSRMKVLAEIVDATRMDARELKERICYFEGQGADMIDLGIPLDARPEQVASALLAARDATDLPLSIDTSVPDLILAGIDGGADLVLSLNAESLSLAGEAVAAADVPAVVVPGPGRASLDHNLLLAQDLGIQAIADPVLDPPMQGLASSLGRYMLFRERHPDMPLFFGAGNVTELLDADSQGVNALLAALAAEVGASILFTPEHSAKAKGSVRELYRASQMMHLAGSRRTPPKDLGLDLLILKEKRPRPEERMPEEAVVAGDGGAYEPDPKGSFRIGVSSGMILAKGSEVAVVGRSASEVLGTLLEMGCVSRLDHAGYLGRELAKAEIALQIGRSYVQDEPLWQKERLNNGGLKKGH
ncbi:MAG: dihydropteroate synthase-like protein [Methanothrix sp.]|nr:dihydropteroate synthase-like protein [Methanothrix sp.]